MFPIDSNAWYAFFPKLLNMSLTGSIVILCVLLARFLLRRQPKVLSCILWLAVVFRLLCPISFTSDFSLFTLLDAPVTEYSQRTSILSYVPEGIVHDAYPEITIPLPVVGETVSEIINARLPQGEVQIGADPLEAPVSIATTLWGMGVLAMLGWSAISYIRLRRRLIGAVPLTPGDRRVMIADHLDTPFVIGIFRPRIYLPSDLAASELDYILLHEQTHIRRFDHLARLLFFASLCIHWFNPLVWMAFFLSEKDMEMSCDESVIQKLGDNVRADYADSLLKLSTRRRLITGIPLAFGEGDTKSRILWLLNKRQYRGWLIALSVLLVCTIVAVCVCNPASEPDPAVVVGEYDASRLGGAYLQSGNPAYAVGVNAYGMPVFEDTGAAYRAFTAEFADAITAVREAHGLSPLTQKNFAMYKKFGWQTDSEDPELLDGCLQVSKFFDLYENSFITEGSVSAPTPTRTPADGLYQGDAFLFQHAGLSFMPDDGSAYAEILLEGDRLAVADFEGSVLYDGDNIGRQSCSREELIDRLASGYFFSRDSEITPEALEPLVPDYRGMDMEICRWYDDDGNVLYAVYCFEGVPTWFVQGDELRFYTLEALPTASDLTESTPGGSASESQPLSTQPAYTDYAATFDDLIIPEHQISNAIMQNYAPDEPDGLLHVESHMLLDSEERINPPSGNRLVTYYLLVSHNSYSTYGGELTEVGGSSMIPTALRFEVDSKNNYMLIEYWEPRDGAGFDDDVRDVFPKAAAEDALHLQGEGAVLSGENYNKALLRLVSSATIDVEIADRLARICSSPAASSNPGDYISAHRADYDLLVGYEAFTLRFCFTEFLHGGQKDLRGHVMASLVRDISLRWHEEVAFEGTFFTGQDWFDAFLAHAQSLQSTIDPEILEKHHPVEWELLELITP